MAQSTNKQRRTRGQIVVGNGPVSGSTRIYEGSNVFKTLSGQLTSSAGSATVFAGVALEEADNRDGAAGALTLKYIKRGEVAMAYSGSTSEGHFMKTAFAVDGDNELMVVTGSTQMTHGNIAGRFLEKHATESGLQWVYIEPRINDPQAK